MLSPKLLEILRDYWTMQRPKAWLYPGDRAGRPITRDAVGQACAKAREISDLSKPITPHRAARLRRPSLLKAVAHVRTIQVLLGHRSLATTRPLSAYRHQQGLRHIEPLRSLAASSAHFVAAPQASVLLSARRWPVRGRNWRIYSVATARPIVLSTHHWRPLSWPVRNGWRIGAPGFSTRSTFTSSSRCRSPLPPSPIRTRRSPSGPSPRYYAPSLLAPSISAPRSVPSPFCTPGDKIRCTIPTRTALSTRDHPQARVLPAGPCTLTPVPTLVPGAPGESLRRRQAPVLLRLAAPQRSQSFPELFGAAAKGRVGRLCQAALRRA